MKIKNIRALEILDSRGNPTVACIIILENGIVARGYVPSGASTGSGEALELRDNDEKRFAGKGVLRACDNINETIFRALKGKDATKQREIDEIMLELDGTENKSKLGANAILGVSRTCVTAAARSQKLEPYQYLAQIFGGSRLTSFARTIILPTPMLNIINGGKHSDSGLDIQEFMIAPQAKSFREKLRQAAEIYQSLKKVIGKAGYSQGVGDEGGFAPKLETNFQALEFIKNGIEAAGYKLGEDVNLALDCAASEFYDEEEKKYILRRPDASLTSDQLLAFYNDWTQKFPIISIEDPFSESDWLAWRKITEKNGKDLLIIGDDLFVTNVKRLERGVQEGAANAILIKPNQIGTITETLDCIRVARAANYKIVISHRSGETCDNFIADLAVAVSADFVKFGAPARGERVAKYNRLLEIENYLLTH
ncbi:MAG: phosphopyruvate hydratase [Patescibacteria group bacterium]